MKTGPVYHTDEPETLKNEVTLQRHPQQRVGGNSDRASTVLGHQFIVVGRR